jgi:DNA repair protein RecN (Recombination protein N)
LIEELSVRDLGVIADLRLVMGPGLTAVTGETGAGKTLIVTAIELLLGARADALVVRPDADEAVIEARFNRNGDEVVLSRVVPANGRSRAYVDGRMATAAVLAEEGSRLVDLHGQHAHQTLLTTAAQRDALDAYAAIDLNPLAEARRRVTEIEERLAGLGGDERARARELDLLRFLVAELDDAALTGPDEDDALRDEEERLGDALAHRASAEAAHEAVSGDGGAVEALGVAVAALAGRAPFAALEERSRSLLADLDDFGAELRSAAESLEEDPARLTEVQDRRQVLATLRRKYGDTLADVIAFGDDARRRMDELLHHDEEAAALERERNEAAVAVEREEAAVRAARAAAAPQLAAQIQGVLATLAMPKARLGVEVGAAGAGDDVTFLLSANPGEPLLPLSRVASGGELARTMLAVRLVLGRAGVRAEAETLVFDEVDAGIGGEAAVAVGRALAALAADRQVLVVTHLPQVAAFADRQIRVEKSEHAGRTIASATELDQDTRVAELSRMLSGRPDSETARDHAAELLEMASAERAAS